MPPSAVRLSCIALTAPQDAAVVTTANGIDEATRKQILDLVKGTGNKDVVLEEKINKDIIGGFIIRIGDKQIDASIARKLNNLKRDLKS